MKRHTVRRLVKEFAFLQWLCYEYGDDFCSPFSIDRINVERGGRNLLQRVPTSYSYDTTASNGSYWAYERYFAVSDDGNDDGEEIRELEATESHVSATHGQGYENVARPIGEQIQKLPFKPKYVVRCERDDGSNRAPEELFRSWTIYKM